MDPEDEEGAGGENGTENDGGREKRRDRVTEVQRNGWAERRVQRE